GAVSGGGVLLPGGAVTDRQRDRAGVPGAPAARASVSAVIDPVVSTVPEGAVIADVRHYLDGRSGRAAYDGGQLTGAVFVDMDTVLASPPSAAEGRHPLPDP